MMAVIGPAGAGKSTLLNALTGKRPGDHGQRASTTTATCTRTTTSCGSASAWCRRSRSPTTSSPRRPRSATRPSCASRRTSGDGGAAPAGGRGARRAVDDPARRHPHRPAVRRPEEAGQHRHGAADQADACCSSTSRPRRSTRTSSATCSRRCARWPTRTAEKGQSVIVITHDVESKLIDQCDRLIVLQPGGKMAYFGPPKRGAELLRRGRLGGRLPGVRRRARAGLRRRVPGVARLREVRGHPDLRPPAAARRRTAASGRKPPGRSSAAASARCSPWPAATAGSCQADRGLHRHHHPAAAILLGALVRATPTRFGLVQSTPARGLNVRRHPDAA